MFLIFGGQQYYAAGGGWDLIGKEEAKEAAQEFAEKAIGLTAIVDIAEQSDDREYDDGHVVEWTHVVDGDSGKVVAEFGKKPYGGGAAAVELRET